jgi:ribonucleoside-diphosphate reductase alpha chain
MPPGPRADPGMQFDTTINDWHTCPASAAKSAPPIPCSEYMFLDDTACNLASLNLMPSAKDDGMKFDVAGVRACRAAVDHRAGNLGADGAVPLAEIAQLSYDYRTLGLGFANIGGLLMARHGL